MERVREVCLVAGGDSSLLWFGLFCPTTTDQHSSRPLLHIQYLLSGYSLAAILFDMVMVYYTGYLQIYTLTHAAPQCPRPTRCQLPPAIKHLATTTYLFDSLRCQHNGMLIPYTHAVFNSDSNSTESLGPSIVIWHIYTAEQRVSISQKQGRQGDLIRLHRNALAGLELIPSGIPRAVVHVQTNEMSQMMWEKRVHCLGSQHVSIHNEEAARGHTVPDTSNPSCCNCSLSPTSAIACNLSRESPASSRQRDTQVRCTFSTALYRSRWASVNLPLTGQAREISDT